MYNYQITGMVDAIVKEAPELADHRPAIVKGLVKYWSDKIAVAWSVEDVLNIAEEKDIRITELEAIEILSKARRNHDSSVGINWGVLSLYVEEYKK